MSKMLLTGENHKHFELIDHFISGTASGITLIGCKLWDAPQFVGL